jgi:acyl carrier protein
MGEEVLDILKKYIEERILDSPGVVLEADTPLLEWGILNSLSTTQLVGFVRDHFGMDVPPEEMVGENFRDLASITRLLQRLDRPVREHS